MGNVTTRWLGHMNEPDIQDGQRGEQHGDTTEDLDRGMVFTLLKNPRRRAVLRHLEDTPETTLADLADRIAAEENDTTPELLSSSERKRVYISLYQSHLPKLAEFGVIEYDQSRGDVLRQPAATRLRAYLRRVDGNDGRLSTVAHATGGVVAVAVLVGTLLAPATAAGWAVGGGVTLLGLCLSESLDRHTLARLRDRLSGMRAGREEAATTDESVTASESMEADDDAESEPGEAARNTR